MFNLLPIKIDSDGEKQRQKLKHFPSIPTSSQVQTHSFLPDSSTTFSLMNCAGGEGEWEHCGQSSTVPLCCSFLLTLFPCSGMGFHGSQSFKIKLKCRSFLQAADLQDKRTPVWALHEPQFLQGMSTCSGMGFSMGCSMDICSSMGPLHQLLGNAFSTMVSSTDRR